MPEYWHSRGRINWPNNAYFIKLNQQLGIMEPVFVNPFDFAFLVMPFIAAFMHRNLKGMWVQARFIAGYAFVG